MIKSDGRKRNSNNCFRRATRKLEIIFHYSHPPFSGSNCFAWEILEVNANISASCFFHWWGGWGGVKIIWGEYNLFTALSLFHFFRNGQHPEKWIQEMWMHQELFLANILNLLKKSFRKTSLFVFTAIGFMEKMFC